MDYIKIVNLVFTVLSALQVVLVIHFAVFFIVGLFKRKKFPATDKKLKYGAIIPARNEEAVVGNLIKSIQKSKYPQDKLQIFVIAHNCTDRTAEIARSLGATVYEYNNPEECTMGYAFRYLFDKIKEDWGIENYDGFFMFNADNVVDENYFDKLNDAFVANGCKKVITSFRNTKNFGGNVISAMYGLYFMEGCRFELRGRTVTGCSTKISGTGYLISSEIVKDGWPYVTLTEDWEFASDQIIKGNKIVYCDEAVFYDEQPTSVKIMLRQRLRWEKGHLLVCVTRFKELMKGLFLSKKKGGSENKFSTYDMLVHVIPLGIYSAALFVLKPVCYAFAPLFGMAAAPIWIAYAKSIAFSFGAFYLGTFITGLLLVILERKRIKNASGGLIALALFLWPFFLLIATPIQVVALFKRNVGWKTIPHKDKTDFERLHGDKAQQQAEESKS